MSIRTSMQTTARVAGSGVQALDFHPVDPTPTPTKPVIDAAFEKTQWLNASPGPNHPCTTGSAPANLFDNNAGSSTGPDTSINGGALTELTTLLGTSAFDCQTSSGELKWTPTGSPSGGTLLITGNDLHRCKYSDDRRQFADHVGAEQQRQPLHRRVPRHAELGGHVRVCGERTTPL